MRSKIILIIFLLNLIYSSGTYSIENKILFRVNNEIITTIDIYEESKILSLMNPNIKNLENQKIFEISKNSLIAEKIKKIEILKNFKEINVDKKYLDDAIESNFYKVNVNNLIEFKNLLKANDISFDNLKNKITIEILWNQIILNKFASKIIINKDKLKSEILKSNNRITKSFLLSEIVFDVENSDQLNEKYALIKNDIEKLGFSNAALIHSISSSKTNNGYIGWIKENQINTEIKNELLKLNKGDLSKPILSTGGFIILKIEDVTESKNKINIDEELKKLIRTRTNKQLDQLSNIYFKKLQKDMYIDAL